LKTIRCGPAKAPHVSAHLASEVPKTAADGRFFDHRSSNQRRDVIVKKTKIVCTIGPASESPEVFRNLVESGLDVARLNFSHGSHEEHLARIVMIKKVRAELERPVAILLDTKGPEIRTGKFAQDVELKEGQTFTLTTEDYLGDQDKCQVSYVGLPQDVVPGTSILIDDGLVGMTVVSKTDTEVVCRVLNGGTIKSNKGVNVPGVRIQLPAITEKDISDIIFGIDNGIDFVAASFIRKPSDVMEIRKVLEDNGGHHIHIISKIENQEGVDNMRDNLEVSDGSMVARGDLGVEIPTERIPLVQKELIRLCNQAGKPVITATQMLDSMIRNPRPTRAETTDVANAIFDGTDAIMLSGETAAGKYPLESVKTMAIIAKAAEESLNYEQLLKNTHKSEVDDNVTFAVSHATCMTALDLEASAIMTATASGFTARKISKFRPKAPIIAATTSEQVRRKLSLVWGVESISSGKGDSTDEIMEKALKGALEAGYVEHGDLVILTAGVPVGVAGATNLMKVQLVGEVLIKGTGIGKGAIDGVFCIASTPEEAEATFKAGDILVCSTTDRDMMPFITKAAGLVVEEGGYTSHAAIVALSLGLPTVVGAADAVKSLKGAKTVTVDATKGIVYAGRTRML
jgi:pyruvate kinase